MKKLIAYIIVFLISYFPQVIVKIAPVRTAIESMHDITVISADFRSVITVLIIIEVIICLYAFFMVYRDGIPDHKYTFVFFFMLICIAVTIAFISPMFNGTVEVKLSARLIPIVVSTIIGVTGAFLVQCLVTEPCDLPLILDTDVGHTHT